MVAKFSKDDLLFALEQAAEFLEMEEWPDPTDREAQQAANKEGAKLIREMAARIGAAPETPAALQRCACGQLPGQPFCLCGEQKKTAVAQQGDPRMLFTHWSKDPLVPYADCKCATCAAASVQQTSFSDGTAPNR